MEVVAETRTILRKKLHAKSHVVLLEDLVGNIEQQRIPFVYNDLISSQCKQGIRIRHFKIVTLKQKRFPLKFTYHMMMNTKYMFKFLILQWNK